MDFVAGGCAGTKIRVEENPFETDGLAMIETDSITVFCANSDWEKLEGARITGVNGEWIFASASVKNRCGCGTSFSFSEKKDPAQLLREKLHNARQLINQK